MAALHGSAFVLISIMCSAQVAAVQVPAVHHSVQRTVHHSRRRRSASNATGASANCPTNKQPTVLFNHISKSGGTALNVLLKEVFGASMPQTKHVDANRDNSYATVQKDTTRISLTDEDAHNFYVIGLVRRPCDYLLSHYYKDHPDMTEQAFKKGFKEFVMNGPYDQGRHVSALMSEAIAERYGTGDRVHCMIREHNLRADFLDCMTKYEACGGVFHASPLNVVDAALVDATGRARSQGRSVGDHTKCLDVFDKEMMAKVLKTEQDVIDKFKLEACCS